MLVFLLIAFLLGLVMGWLLNRGPKAEKEKKVKNNNVAENIIRNTNQGYNKSRITDQPSVEARTIASATSAENIPIKAEAPTIPASPKVFSERQVEVKIDAPVVTPMTEQTQAPEVNKISDGYQIPLSSEEIDLDSKVDLKSEGYGVQNIEGIGPKTAGELKIIGIHNVADLLKNAYNNSQRDYLSKQLKLRVDFINKWASMSDLLRIDGIDHQFAELISSSGVKTIKGLAVKDANNFVKRMEEINTSRSKLISPIVPNAEQVSNWIEQAKNMKEVVTFD
jgi:predicted flap endonuclease-1-like 5' DNA nuclease